MSLKKVLNLHEAATELRLRQACERHGARVYTKVRVADVLPIEGSGISDAEYRYALMAHFDFLIADDQHDPLFAVEFDGPTHESAEQSERDAQKDRLCLRFSLPILRVNQRYLAPKYRSMDLLSWFVDVWFAKRWFDGAQLSGEVPYDEVFAPWAMARMPGHKKSFPLFLTANVRNKMRDMFLDGRVKSFGPSALIGVDQNGNYRAIGAIAITNDTGVMVESAMRAQQFPVSQAGALHELVIFDLFNRLEAVLAEADTADPWSSVVARWSILRSALDLRFMEGSGDLN